MDSTPLGNSDPRCYFNHSIAETAALFCVSEQAVLRLIQQRSLRGQFRHGRWWVHLGPGQGQDRVVRLWHGTSRDRVFSIMAHRFELATGGKQSWLTTGELYARKAAIGSAQKRGSSSVILCCDVDVERYQVFWKRGEQFYVFHEPPGRDVIRFVGQVDEREGARQYRMAHRRFESDPLPDVEINPASGASGVWYWVDCYRNLLAQVT